MLQKLNEQEFRNFLNGNIEKYPEITKIMNKNFKLGKTATAANALVMVSEDGLNELQGFIYSETLPNKELFIYNVFLPNKFKENESLNFEFTKALIENHLNDFKDFKVNKVFAYATNCTIKVFLNLGFEQLTNGRRFKDGSLGLIKVSKEI